MANNNPNLKIKKPLRSRAERLADEFSNKERQKLKEYTDEIMRKLDESIKLFEEKERILRKIINDFETFVRETYMPVSGDVEDHKLMDFLVNTNIVTVKEVNTALVALSDSRSSLKMIVDEKGEITLPDYIKRDNILDISIIYPNGTTETFNQKVFRDDKTILLYNHFEDDAIGREILIEYISLDSKVSR